MMMDISQQTRDIVPILDQSLAVVYDVGLILIKLWLNVSCLLGVNSLTDAETSSLVLISYRESIYFNFINQMIYS